MTDVAVGVGVFVGAGVFVRVGVAVGSGVFVKVTVAVGSGVSVTVGVAVGSGDIIESCGLPEMKRQRILLDGETQRRLDAGERIRYVGVYHNR